MGELEEYRAKLTIAIGRTLEAEDEYFSHELGTPARRAALQDLIVADTLENEARENLRLYLQCPKEQHGPIAFQQDPDGSWIAVCPDCQGCQDGEGVGAPEVGRGATQQEAFDDLHERLGTNAS